MPPGLGTEQIWSEMHDRLLAFVRGRVGSLEDAEDILQDVFVRIHAGLDRLADSDSVTAWTYRITRNAIVDYRRARAKAANVVAAEAENIAEADSGDGAERDAVEEFSHCVEPMLGELPEHYRQAVTLTELGGMTQADAAAKLGLSVSGMKARVQRGRGKLKEVLLDCCSVEFDRRGGLVDYQRRTPDGCGDDCDCGPGGE